MGGALSCCLPCAGAGEPSGVSSGDPISSAPSVTTTALDKALLQKRLEGQFELTTTCKAATAVKVELVHEESLVFGNFQESYISGIKEEDDGDDRVEVKEVAEDEEGEDDDDGTEFRECDPVAEEDEAYEHGGQHRLSPRLHDIEEEDDDDGRSTFER